MNLAFLLKPKPQVGLSVKSESVMLATAFLKIDNIRH